MAWTESHQSLLNHPKIFRLMSLTGDSRAECIGRLEMLWANVLQYAEDGDLSRISAETIALWCDYDKKYHDPAEFPKAAKRFFGALIEAGWIDSETFFVHDWLDYAGRYLKSKYHSSNPKRYREIIRKHQGPPKGRLKSHIPIDKPLITETKETIAVGGKGASAAIHDDGQEKRQKKKLSDDEYRTVCEEQMHAELKENRELWKKSYPGLDIEKGLSQALSWLKSHTHKRRSKFGAFFNGWLARDYRDMKGPARQNPARAGPPRSMNRNEQNLKTIANWTPPELRGKS